jgi:hypothetical protein
VKNATIGGVEITEVRYRRTFSEEPLTDAQLTRRRAYRASRKHFDA